MSGANYIQQLITEQVDKQFTLQESEFWWIRQHLPTVSFLISSSTLAVTARRAENKSDDCKSGE